MKIQYASDLHLELGRNGQFIKNSNCLIEPIGDVLVLAGDIAYLDSKEYGHKNYKWFFDFCSENFKETYIVPGNHEFYGYYDVATLPDNYSQELRKNVHICYNSVIHLSDNIDLILSTLWGEIPQLYERACEQCVSDFHRILYNNQLLKGAQFTELHKHCFDFIKESVSNSKADHKIVATHHLPTLSVMAPEFIGSSINGAFVTELADYIESSDIEYWIYGHSHRNIDTQIGNTKIVSNQLGYVSARENTTFNSYKHIEL